MFTIRTERCLPVTFRLSENRPRPKQFYGYGYGYGCVDGGGLEAGGGSEYVGETDGFSGTTWPGSAKGADAAGEVVGAGVLLAAMSRASAAKST